MACRKLSIPKGFAYQHGSCCSDGLGTFTGLARRLHWYHFCALAQEGAWKRRRQPKLFPTLSPAYVAACRKLNRNRPQLDT